MEERSPGGFSPTKWAQFANSPRLGRRGPAAAGGGARRRLRPGPAALLPPGARSRPDFPGGGGEAEGEGKAAAAGSGRFFFSFGPFLRPSSAPVGPGHGGGPQPGREDGRAGAEGEAAPPPRTNKRRRLQPEPAPRPPPPDASSRPGSALRPPPAPPRRDESASLRCSVLPPARRAVAAVAAALGKWRPSSFSLPPFNLKRRENGASERAGERRGHGEEGQQRLRRLRLRRRRAAPPRRAARGRPPRRPRGPPGGAAAAASVMAPRRRRRCFCTSICGGRRAGPQLLPDARRRHAALRQAGAGPCSCRGEANLRHWRRHIPSAPGLAGPRARYEGQDGLARRSERTWARNCVHCVVKRLLPRVPDYQAKRALRRGQAPWPGRRSPPPFVLAACLCTLQHAWALAPTPRSAAAKVKKKKKGARRCCAGAGQGPRRASPGREGAAGSDRGSDGPPAPGPLGTVVFGKKHTSCLGCQGLADPPKQANGITQWVFMLPVATKRKFTAMLKV